MYDVIIIGAGAAGMMAAGTAAQNGKKVLVIEKMEKAGRKIRITGKGRCNLTNARPPEEFAEQVRTNADFFATAFAEFNNRATIRFFERRGLKLDFERGDRVFPHSGKAWDVANTLEEWCRDNGVEFWFHTRVTGLMTLGGKIFGVRYMNRRGFERKEEAARVIVATGGVSYPATGSTGDGYTFASEAGHDIEPLRPSLTPLVSPHPQLRELHKLLLRNIRATLFIDGEAVREEFGEIGFSERGIEGAVALRMSRDAVDALIDGRRVKLSLDLKPALTIEILQERIRREIAEMPEEEFFAELLRKLLPKPLVMPVCKELVIQSKTYVKKIGDKEIDRLISLLKGFVLPISDYAPFEYAVVTAGGVRCDEVNRYTMESLKVKGLYLPARCSIWTPTPAATTSRLHSRPDGWPDSSNNETRRPIPFPPQRRTTPQPLGARTVFQGTRRALAVRLRDRAAGIHENRIARRRPFALRRPARTGRERTPRRAVAEPLYPLRIQPVRHEPCNRSRSVHRNRRHADRPAAAAGGGRPTRGGDALHHGAVCRRRTPQLLQASGGGTPLDVDRQQGLSAAFQRNIAETTFQTMTKVYTKTGDKGTTSLVGGERVSKIDERVEAYGTVDELGSFTAYLSDHLRSDEELAEYLGDLDRVASQLMSVAALLAVGHGGEGKLPDISPEAIGYLEERIDAMQSRVRPITKFTIPGGHPTVSLCHVCRTVCRRAERASLRAAALHPTISANTLAYLNRLSDYFYLLGRALTEYYKVEETLWRP